MYLLRRMVEHLMIWRVPRHSIHGVEIWTPIGKPEEQKLALSKLEKARELLVQCSPVRAERVRALKGVVIFGTTKHTARYLRDSNLCQLWPAFVESSETTPERLANALVHEATHAWLFRLGFGYEETIRTRVERICVLAELGVAKRFPNGKEEIQSLESFLAELSSETERLSDTIFEERLAADFRHLGFPEWIIRMILFIRRCIRRITACSTRTSKLAGELKR
jgi:hypothetical protein